MEEQKKKKTMESVAIEKISIVAAAALFIFCVKHYLPLVLRRLSAATPPPLLFLVLHLTVASIAFVSIHQSLMKKNYAYEKTKCEEKEEEADDEEGDLEELNAKVEAFIRKFKHQLRIESFSSKFHA